MWRPRPESGEYSLPSTRKSKNRASKKHPIEPPRPCKENRNYCRRKKHPQHGVKVSASCRVIDFPPMFKKCESETSYHTDKQQPDGDPVVQKGGGTRLENARAPKKYQGNLFTLNLEARDSKHKPEKNANLTCYPIRQGDG